MIIDQLILDGQNYFINNPIEQISKVTLAVEDEDLSFVFYGSEFNAYLQIFIGLDVCKEAYAESKVDNVFNVVAQKVVMELAALESEVQ